MEIKYIRNTDRLLNGDYVIRRRLDLSKEVLQVSVGQRAAELPAVKVGGLKINPSAQLSAGQSGLKWAKCRILIQQGCHFIRSQLYFLCIFFYSNNTKIGQVTSAMQILMIDSFFSQALYSFFWNKCYSKNELDSSTCCCYLSFFIPSA